MERRFREIDPPLIPKVVNEINAHCLKRRWGKRYAPTVILGRIALSRWLLQSHPPGECLDPQMKNLLASDTSFRKAKGWGEVGPAENTQNYKRLILLSSGQGEQQEDKGLLLGKVV